MTYQDKNLHTMDIQGILTAVQNWGISTGRARELIQTWLDGKEDIRGFPEYKPCDIREDENPHKFIQRIKIETMNYAIGLVNGLYDVDPGGIDDVTPFDKGFNSAITRASVVLKALRDNIDTLEDTQSDD